MRQLTHRGELTILTVVISTIINVIHSSAIPDDVKIIKISTKDFEKYKAHKYLYEFHNN